MPRRFHPRIDRLEVAARVYIIPTRIGFYFTFILFILFLIAISYGHNLAFFATFLFFSFVALSAVVTNENISSLDISWKSELFRGRESKSFPAQVTLSNNSGKSRYDITIEVEGKIVGRVSEILPGAHIDVDVDLGKLELSRGIYAIEKIVLSTTFPFGLFYSWSWKRCSTRLNVIPRGLSRRVIELSSGAMQIGEGSISNKLGNDEFYEVRPHRRGEGQSRIDRRLSLKLDAPQVREYRDQAVRARVIDLQGGVAEEQLAIAVFWLEHLNDDYMHGVIFPDGSRSSISLGTNHRNDLYDQISSFEKKLEVLV